MRIFNLFKKKKVFSLSDEEQLRLKGLLMKCDKNLIASEFSTNNIDVIIDGLTPFQYAFQGKCDELMQYFIELGADVNKRFPDRSTALIVACGDGSYELAKLLIENGADVNLINDAKTAAIWYATTEINKQIVELLLDNGANPFIDSGNGISTYEMAKRMNLSEIIQLMDKYKSKFL
ncbi:MAG: ankyrin repeat domain-containing protein [Brumimicrobium sp.]